MLVPVPRTSASWPSTHTTMVRLCQADPASTEFRRGWEALYWRYFSRSYALLRRTGSRRQAAEDMVQDWFIADLDGRHLRALDRSLGTLAKWMYAKLVRWRASEWRKYKKDPLRGAISFNRRTPRELLSLGERLADRKGRSPAEAHRYDMAMATIQAAFAAVAKELTSRNSRNGLRVLWEWVAVDENERPPISKLAASLRMGEKAVWNRAGHLLKRVREEIVAEVRLRLLPGASEEDVFEEMKHLADHFAMFPCHDTTSRVAPPRAERRPKPVRTRGLEQGSLREGTALGGISDPVPPGEGSDERGVPRGAGVPLPPRGAEDLPGGEGRRVREAVPPRDRDAREHEPSEHHADLRLREDGGPPLLCDGVRSRGGPADVVRDVGHPADGAAGVRPADLRRARARARARDRPSRPEAREHPVPDVRRREGGGLRGVADAEGEGPHEAHPPRKGRPRGGDARLHGARAACGPQPRGRAGGPVFAGRDPLRDADGGGADRRGPASLEEGEDHIRISADFDEPLPPKVLRAFLGKARGNG